MNKRQLVRISQLTGKEGILGFSRATLWRKVGKGDFPPPIKIGYMVAWEINDVYAWIDKHKNKGESD